MNKMKITTKEAAYIIGASPQFVREAMKQGLLDIGVSCRMPNSKMYTYNISKAKLEQYVGHPIDDDIATLRTKDIALVED